MLQAVKVTFASMCPMAGLGPCADTSGSNQLEESGGGFDPGKMTSTVTTGGLTVERPTWRSGDWVHVLFSALLLVLGLVILATAIRNDTLFDGVTTPALILASVGYAYFGLTRIVNRRTVTVTTDRITAKDGPLPILVRSVNADLDAYGKAKVRSAMRFTFPPTSRYRLYYVGGEMAPDLFRRLPTEDEAKYAVARIRSFTTKQA